MYERLSVEAIQKCRVEKEIVYRCDIYENKTLWLLMYCDGSVGVIVREDMHEAVIYRGSDLTTAILRYRAEADRIGIHSLDEDE